MNATRNSLPAVARKGAVRILNGTVGDPFDVNALDEFATTTLGQIDSAAERAPALLADMVRDLDKELWIPDAHLSTQP